MNRAKIVSCFPNATLEAGVINVCYDQAILLGHLGI